LGERIGRGLQKFHEGKGVTFHLAAKVEKLVPSSSDPSAVGAVVVNGKEVPADIVVLGVGVSPATEFLRNSGIEIQKDGGVEVDEFLKVKGVQDVYAIGGL
jgi:apoptosis-inducing factor 3